MITAADAATMLLIVLLMIDAVMVFVYIAIGVGAALTVYHHVLGGVL